MVQFTYEEKGVRSAGDGKWYPLVTMDWVKGDTLYQYLRVQCLRGNGKAVERLCELSIGRRGPAHFRAHRSWRPPARQRDGGQERRNQARGLRLYVRAGVGRPEEPGNRGRAVPASGTKREYPANPQPRQLLGDFYPRRAKALAAEPALWERYIEKDGYEKLLFRGEDLHNPRNSQLIRDLMRSRDGSVSALCNTLVELVRMKLEDVPRLEDAIFRWPPVESFLNQRDFDSALELLMRSKKRIERGSSPTPTASPQRRRTDSLPLGSGEGGPVRGRARDAAVLPPAAAGRLPAAQPVVAVARQAVKVIPILERLEEEFIAKQWRQFVKVWEDNQTLLAGRSSAGRFEEDVRKWKARNGAWDALQGDFPLAELGSCRRHEPLAACPGVGRGRRLPRPDRANNPTRGGLENSPGPTGSRSGH